MYLSVSMRKMVPVAALMAAVTLPVAARGADMSRLCPGIEEAGACAERIVTTAEGREPASAAPALREASEIMNGGAGVALVRLPSAPAPAPLTIAPGAAA